MMATCPVCVHEGKRGTAYYPSDVGLVCFEHLGVTPEQMRELFAAHAAGMSDKSSLRQRLADRRVPMRRD